MLDSFYHMTSTMKYHFWRKNVIILSLSRNVVMDVITFPVTTSGLSILLHGVLSLPNATSYDKIIY